MTRSPDMIGRFLMEFAACGNIPQAAKSRSLSPVNHEVWLRIYPKYRERFRSACRYWAEANGIEPDYHGVEATA